MSTLGLTTFKSPCTGVDLVVHTAGPFQRAEDCTVLQAAISTKVEQWHAKLLRLNSISYKYCVKFPDKIKQCLTQSPANAIGWHNFKYFTEQTAYIDVCDDTDYSWRAKGFHEQAKSAGVPAITTAGIYPGVSNGLHISSIQFLRFAFCLSLSVVSI